MSSRKALKPAPPDATITSTQTLLRTLFNGRTVSNNDLQRYFATPGRKANDRVDMTALRSWLDIHRARFEAEASKLIADLEAEWALFTNAAAREAGRRRRKEGQEGAVALCRQGPLR